ncbi:MULTISPECIES: peptidase S24 [Elizabethkingia]|uniref:peptidase S24 n=1 Tax=Elizabethkingia TaxID=308865 RepID=UPI0020A1C3A1|nr:MULTISPECIES: peptidase S24 [unclassified Elizabethkingia]MCP1250583.1 peptidase S24 [Elizabethkingia sp. S0634]MDX8571769.1 peptidase S24 [Elizabethkingia sp. HX QKY]
MIIDRILQIIDFKGINKNKFYKEAGLSNGFLDKVRKDIGSSKIEQILKAYPEINPDWFLTGEGNMLKKDVPSTSVKESLKAYSQEEEKNIINELEKRYKEDKELYEKLILSYKERISELKEEIVFLREQLKK